MLSFQLTFEFHSLKAKGTHSLTLLLDEGFVELENDGDGKQDTSSCTNGTHEIGNDRQGSNAHSTKCCSGRNVTIQDVDQGRVTVSLHDHLVIAELLGDVAGRRARHFDPCLTEQSTCRQNESQVENSVEWIVNNFGKRTGWRNVVGDSTDGDLLSGSTVHILPLAQETDQHIGWSAVVQELGDEVQVGDKGGLKDDGHVGSVKELDRIVSLLPTVFLVLDGKVDSPSLEIDDNYKNQDSGQKISQVGKILTVESLTNCLDLVGSRNEEVEKSNDSTLELSSTTSVDGSWTKGLPDDSLANVGSDKERDTRSKTIPLLQELVKSQDNKTGAKELEDDQKRVTGTDGTQVTIHSTDNISNRFTESNQETKELLGPREQGAIFLDVVVDFNDTRSSQKLHDKTGGNNGTDTKFHQCTTVGSENDTHPVEGIGRLGTLNTIDGDLAANQENEESNGSPEELLTERNLDGPE
jgi:hypothetical protein